MNQQLPIIVSSARRCGSTVMCEFIKRLFPGTNVAHIGDHTGHLLDELGAREGTLAAMYFAAERFGKGSPVFFKTHFLTPTILSQWIGETDFKVISPYRDVEEAIVSNLLFIRRRELGQRAVSLPMFTGSNQQFVYQTRKCSDEEYVNRLIGERGDLLRGVVQRQLPHLARPAHPQIKYVPVTSYSHETAIDIANFLRAPVVTTEAIRLLSDRGFAENYLPAGHNRTGGGTITLTEENKARLRHETVYTR